MEEEEEEEELEEGEAEADSVLRDWRISEETTVSLSPAGARTKLDLS